MRSCLAFSAVLAGALLLTACGTAEPGAYRPTPTHDAGVCPPPLDPADVKTAGVEITAPGGGSFGCGPATAADTVAIGFQVTNHEAEPFTYTVLFEVTTASGQALGNSSVTVPDVGPGQTVHDTAHVSDTFGRQHGAARVRIEKVRSVPTDEAPATGGSCPASGIQLSADEGSAAMGLRVVGLHLVNCSTRPYRISGFPQLQLLDLQRQSVTGVAVLHGSGGISGGLGFDDPPRQVTLQPGESASSGLAWRNTVTNGAPVNVPYVRVTAKPGEQPVVVTPELDLGTTGKLGVSPWKKDAATR